MHDLHPCMRGPRSALGGTLAVVDNDTFVDEPGVDDAGGTEAQPIDEQLIEDELLIEEISIDGMCGVY